MTHKDFSATHLEGSQSQKVWDSLAVESPLQIQINEEPLNVTMRTPGEDKHLAFGYLYTEGVIENLNDVGEWEFQPEPNIEGAGILNLQIPVEKINAFNISQRSNISNSSCGVCGKTKLCELHFPKEALRSDFFLQRKSFAELRRKMELAQLQFQKTGGCHGAALFNSSGDLICLMEDIGRHNAVDKAIGFALCHHQLEAAQIMFVTGRVSYEIIIKAYRAQIPYLLAISAPSSLAVSLCEQAGICLIGFCRGNRGTVYTLPQNIHP